MTVINVRNVGKAYRVYRSQWQRFATWFGVQAKPIEEHWVLRNVSFEGHHGESIGIIGKNGAGKSTLLKMITGTLHPSEGTVSVSGHIAAILELGMGFNPELTGRQNAVHSLGLMGHSADTIAASIANIEIFADIGEYFDQQVRMYSSGMQARVAFAVATAVRPDVIIIDEVLAVGDAAFQRKCFRLLENFIEQGTTLLFVSHDIESVKALCDKALLIADGSLLEFGEAKRICDLYEKTLFKNIAAAPLEHTDASLDPALTSNCEESYGDGRALIESIWLEDEQGRRANVFPSHTPMRICYRLRALEDLARPIFAFMIKTKEGIAVFGTDSEYLAQHINVVDSAHVMQVTFTIDLTLAPGIYYLNCGIRDSTTDEIIFMHRRVDALLFRVIRSEKSSSATGLADLSAKLKIEHSNGN